MRNIEIRHLLLTGSAAAALATGGPAMAAAAAAPQPQAKEAVVEEVVVTARRREENLKDVPIAVTVFSAEKMSQAGVQNITDLQKSAPNLTLQVARGSNSTTTAFIRGIGQQDPLWGFEPGVGLYVDDVYVARPQGAVMDVYNVDHIEVLRGPQGSLYGRNTIGGAVKYVTARMPDTIALDAKAQYGSYNERDLTLTGSIPLSDMLKIGGGFERSLHDGYGKNLLTGADNYNKDVTAERITVEFRPTDKVLFRLSGDNFLDKSNSRVGHREIPGDALASKTMVIPVTPDPFDNYSGMNPKNKVWNNGYTLLAQYDASPEWTFKSISAIRHGTTRTNIDFAAVPNPELQVPGRYYDNQFTQELQGLYNGAKLKGVFGVFYLDGLAGGDADTILGNAGLTLNFSGKAKTQSWAGFGDFSYDLTDRLQLSLGGRWTTDRREGSVYRIFEVGLGSPEFGGPGKLLQVRTNYTNTHNFEKFTPHLAANFKLTDEVSTYASYSEGFKSGGFDMRGDAFLTPQTSNGYGPEFVKSYELGVKGSFFDHRLDLNTAAFFADYTDLQVTIQTPATAPAVGIASVVENAGKSTIDGFEIEGHARPGGPITANFSVGLADANFDHTPLLAASNVLVFQNTPKWTGYFQLVYTAPEPVLNGKLSANASASYRSKTYQYSFPIPQIDQPAYTLYDANITWTSASDRWRVGLHGLNLGDEHYRVGGYNLPGLTFGNTLTAFYGNPRTVLLSLEMKY